MFAYLALFHLRLAIRAALVTDFVFRDDVANTEIPSLCPHSEWMRRAPGPSERDEKETLTMQLHIINCVHGWRLSEPWGTLPGDGAEGEGVPA